MRRVCCGSVLLALVGCGGPEPAPMTCESPAAPTWHSFGQGYVHTWCTPCHSASLPADKRQGAPVGVDLDTHDDVASHAGLVRAVTSGDTPTMPPLGGITPEARALFDLWLECGAPGGDPAPDPCLSATELGSETIASATEAEALCAAGKVSVEGLTVTGDAVLDCVCDVRGALVVSGGHAVLADLRAVGGAVMVTDAATGLEAPTLGAVGEGFRADAVGLTTLEVPQLGVIDGSLEIHDVPLLGVRFMGLQHAGSVDVHDLVKASEVRMPRLRTVGGDLRLVDLPALGSLSETNAVERIGGDLVLERLGIDTLDHWGFSFLQHVGGSVTFAENPHATDLGGFTLLGDPVAAGKLPAGIEGSLTIRDNPALRGITGFDTLRNVPGSLVIAQHQALEGILGFKNLATVQGDLRITDAFVLDVLTGFRPLTEVGGMLELGTSGELDGVDGFEQVESAGGVWLHDHAELRDLDGLGGLRSVSGDVTVTDNPVLTSAEIDGWLDTVGRGRISGAITVERNAD